MSGFIHRWASRIDESNVAKAIALKNTLEKINFFCKQKSFELQSRFDKNCNTIDDYLASTLENPPKFAKLLANDSRFLGRSMMRFVFAVAMFLMSLYISYKIYLYYSFFDLGPVKLMELENLVFGVLRMYAFFFSSSAIVFVPAVRQRPKLISSFFALQFLAALAISSSISMFCGILAVVVYLVCFICLFNLGGIFNVKSNNSKR